MFIELLNIRKIIFHELFILFFDIDKMILLIRLMLIFALKSKSNVIYSIKIKKICKLIFYNL